MSIFLIEVSSYFCVRELSATRLGIFFVSTIMSNSTSWHRKTCGLWNVLLTKLASEITRCIRLCHGVNQILHLIAYI